MKARNPSTGTLETVYVKALDSMPVGTEVDFDGSASDIPTGWEETPYYSTTQEVKTGKKWIDGSDIYVKCFSGNVGSGTAVNFTINNVAKLIDYGGFTKFVDGSGVWQFSVNSTYGDNTQNAIRIVKPPTANRITMQVGTNLSNRDYEVFIEYTKSS